MAPDKKRTGKGKKPTAENDPLLRLSQAARMLGLSVSHVRQLSAKGSIAVEELPTGERMYRQSAVDAYMEFREKTPIKRGRPAFTEVEKAERALERAKERLERAKAKAAAAAKRKASRAKT